MRVHGLKPSIGAVLLAAGAGRRFGGAKQFQPLGGRPLFHWPLEVFHSMPSVRSIVLVVPAERREGVLGDVRRRRWGKVAAVVAGGRERADSVRAGLAAMVGDPDVLLIHDAARALVTRDIVERVAAAAHRTGAALAAWPASDTLKRSRPAGERHLVRSTLPREGVWLAQTPQGFRSDVVKRKGFRLSSRLTDDVQAAERKGWPVELVKGSIRNFKVTLPEDFELCRALWKKR